MKTFGEKLKDLRLEKKLTQKELAQILSITTPTLSHWECDYQEPSLKDLIQICAFFNVESDYLIGLSDNFENFTIRTEKPADFSDEELTLIEKYRRLQTGYQVLIGKQIQVLLDHQKKSELPAQQEYGSQKKTNSKSR